MYVKVITQYSYWEVHEILLFLFLVARGFNMGNIFQPSLKVINNVTEECWVCVSFLQSRLCTSAHDSTFHDILMN
jgi:hypothetical protein